MKKILNIKRYPIIVDTETLDIEAIPERTRGIDSIYVIPEDAKLTWESKDNDPVSVDVKKDDILITFYDTSLGKNFVVVNSEDWKSMLDASDKKRQEEKEKWAAKQIESAHVNTVCGDACCESL